MSLIACTGSIADPEPGSSAPHAKPPTANHPATMAAASSDKPSETQDDAPATPMQSDGGSAGASACEGAEVDPGPSPLSLLTRSQYLNTVQDLFGALDGVDSALGSDQSPSAFGLVQADVDRVQLENYQKAAELIAGAVTADAKRLQALAPCAAGADSRDCARDFVRAFGSRAYRAPLSEAADLDQHMKLYDLGKPTSHAHGIELALRGMLQSPRFLYRVEIGTQERVGPNAIALSGYERAARLSFSLWERLPDAKLMAAAADGALDDADGVLAQLAWMLDDDKGRALLRRFLEQWIHLDDLDDAVKDAKLFPDWASSGLRPALEAQAGRFFDYILDEQAGRLSSLLSSPSVFVKRELNGYYGASAGDDFQMLAQPDRSSGLLTLPALLSLLAKPNESSPIYRGKFVRESLLCQQLPAPPANIPRPPEVTPGVSTRERLQQHEVDPACSGCHQLMDPIGFAFEHFDAVGRYRELDGKQSVDARGKLVSSGELDGPIDGVVDLGQKLAGSAEVQDCMARQWFRFALARFERDSDACSVERLVAAFKRADASLNALPSALVESDAFLYRRPLDAKDNP